MSSQSQALIGSLASFPDKHCLKTNTTSINLDIDGTNSSFLVQSNNVGFMYIDAYANVGINNVAPAYQLDVASANGACLALRYGNTETKSFLTVSNTGNLSISVSGTEINTTANLNVISHNGSTAGLMLANSLVLASAAQLNYNVVSPGTASANKALVLDINADISAIRNISQIGSLTNTLLTASTSSTTGALLLSGGIGCDNTTDASSSTNGGSITTAGGAAFAKRVFIGQSLSVGGTDLTAAAWADNGIQFNVDAAIYTNTSTAASGTVALTTFNSFAKPTLGSTNAGVVSTIASTVYIADAPGVDANTTITNAYALHIANGDSLIATTTDTSSLTSGALVINGGVAITKKLLIGSTATLAGADMSAAAWGANGIILNAAATNCTDTSSSGTVALLSFSSFARPTIIASSASTYTNAATVYIAGTPIASTNATITNNWSLYVASGNSGFNGILKITDTTTPSSNTTGALIVSGGVGIAKTTYIGWNLVIGGTNLQSGAWGANGVLFRSMAGTITDITSSGTVAIATYNSFAVPTIAATNITTYTNIANVYIAGAATISTNVTATNNWALYIAAGNTGFNAPVRIIDATDSTTASTGSITTAGGLGIAKSLCVGNTFAIGGIAFSSAAWGVNGIQTRRVATTYTDTSSTGTVAFAAVNSFAASTIAASSTTTYTDAASLYIAGAVVAGTNATITNRWALYIASGNSTLYGILRFMDTNDTVSTATGALAMAGGLGIAKSLFVGYGVRAGGTAYSTSAWGVNGITYRSSGAFFTDTSSTGTVAALTINSFAVSTIIASSATTYTNAANVYIAGAVVASTNATFTNNWALYIAAGNTGFNAPVRILDATNSTSTSTGSIITAGGLGIAKSLYVGNTLAVGGTALSSAAWGVSGIQTRSIATTYTDTSSTGTVASVAINSYAVPTIAASSATIYTNAATVYIAGTPAASTNVTITNPLSLHIAAGNAQFGGKLSVMVGTNPTYGLDFGTLGAPPAMGLNLWGGTRGLGASSSALDYYSDSSHKWFSVTEAQGGNSVTNPVGTNTMTLTSAGVLSLPTTSGALAIGVATPSFPLDIQTSTTTTQSATPYGYLRTSGAASTSLITSVAVSIRCTGAVFASEVDVMSDRRIKQDIEVISLEDAKLFIQQVIPVHYTLKKDRRKAFGYIAQDILKVNNHQFQELVSLQSSHDPMPEEIDDDGFVSPANAAFAVSYDQAIPLLHKVIQDQMNTIADLQARLASVEALLYQNKYA